MVAGFYQDFVFQRILRVAVYLDGVPSYDEVDFSAVNDYMSPEGDAQALERFCEHPFRFGTTMLTELKVLVAVSHGPVWRALATKTRVSGESALLGRLGACLLCQDCLDQTFLTDGCRVKVDALAGRQDLEVSEFLTLQLSCGERLA